VENHSSLQTEIVYAPQQTPTGASVQQYRSHAQPVSRVALISASLLVELLDDPDRARFTFECVVEPEGVARGVEFASRDWAYDIPAPHGEISGLSAWDAEGTLQTQLQPGESRATRLRVGFRRMVRHGDPYRFWYAYEAPVRGVVTDGLLTRSVACTGWLLFNLPCESIRVCIQLPAGARLVKSAPAGEVTEPETGPPRIRFHVEKLRALDTCVWMVAYQLRRIGLPLYLWTASQLAAAFVGWVIGRALDGWAG
jgi:hypothetical protein